MADLRGLHIGGVLIKNPLVLAPMAGVCDLPFRLICKHMGCALVYTEMISSMALWYRNRRTSFMLTLSEREHPVSVQIFGSNPEVMAQAARVAAASGADIVDINMGCPVPKVVKNEEGCALMRRPGLAQDIVRAVVSSAGVPVTVKIRMGWDDASANAVEFAQACVEAGASAVAVHGRTRAQGYQGNADWGIIARVKAAVSVPVIGNGDVRDPLDVARMMDETACDGVMIGRGALGNPWIFRRSLHYLATGEVPPEPTAVERIDMALNHLDTDVEYKGAKTATSEMRKHLAWYIRGLPRATRVRDLVNTAGGPDALRRILTAYRDQFERGT
ncbi:MAG: tRNA dihydrouridine synthase DusB [Firmicutes bacterium]|jgi:tRNA-dihydrouridine synthase B|nr:tRNA dihydrouridine synthase DusB [Bacillota bacterium]